MGFHLNTCLHVFISNHLISSWIFMDSLQLKQELKENHTFEGWEEGVLNFAPTYKYKLNSENYEIAKRFPAWYVLLC